MPDNLYYTQLVRGFQQQSAKYSEENVIIPLIRTKHRCPRCGSEDVTITPISYRSIRGVPIGVCREVYLEFTSHRLYCRHCKARAMEHIPFLSHPKAQITKAFERTILELRQHMSLRAISTYFRLRWHTIEELEKKHLKKRFSKILVYPDKIA